MRLMDSLLAAAIVASLAAFYAPALWWEGDRGSAQSDLRQQDADMILERPLRYMLDARTHIP